MGKKISIAHYLSVPASEEGDVTIYEVEAARKFRVTSVHVTFPLDTNFELEVSVYRGIRQIAPHVGSYRGDGQVIEDDVDEEFSSSERVILHYKNNSTTSTRNAFILVRGELE